MNYNIFVNQRTIIEHGLDLDIKDAVILDFIKNMPLSNSIKKILIGDVVYFWVSYSHVIKQNPLLKISSTDTVYRRMIKFVEMGILGVHPDNQKMNKSYYCLTDKFNVIFTGGDVPKIATSGKKSEGPTEKNPEVPTDLNPDDYNTNKDYNNNDSNLQSSLRSDCEQTVLFSNKDLFITNSNKGEKLKKNREQNLREKMVEFWLKEVHDGWAFNGQDGKKINSLISKVKYRLKCMNSDQGDETCLNFFKTFCLNLPDFYKDKTLSVLESHFDTIVEQIILNNNGKPKYTTAATRAADSLRYFESLK